MHSHSRNDAEWSSWSTVIITPVTVSRESAVPVKMSRHNHQHALFVWISCIINTKCGARNLEHKIKNSEIEKCSKRVWLFLVLRYLKRLADLF